ASTKETAMSSSTRRPVSHARRPRGTRKRVALIPFVEDCERRELLSTTMGAISKPPHEVKLAARRSHAANRTAVMKLGHAHITTARVRAAAHKAAGTKDTAAQVVRQVHRVVKRASAPAAKKADNTRNVIIFVADGLRPGSVNPTDAPTLSALRAMGVNFTNSHAVFPTFTTPNSAAIATGHYPGDTGDFSNTVFVNYPVLAGTNTPFLESDPVLGDIDEHFGGNFLGEDTLLSLARAAGYNTAAVGKVGPVLIQDVTQGNPSGGSVPVPQAIIIDDSTGKTGGIPLDPALQQRMIAAGVSITAPDRSNGAPSTSQLSNGFSGSNTTPGTLEPNSVQQQYFADATTKVILPQFSESKKPFALVFWSRDPDGTQHN